MALSEEDRKLIDTFRDYLEGEATADERYGEPTRHDREDESVLATRFAAGPSSWFEVAVHPVALQVRVGFATSDPATSDEVVQAIQESGETMEKFVEGGFRDAGLNWPNPPVEHSSTEDGCHYFVTSLAIVDVVDLEMREVRRKVPRMLEGYLIAFGPAVVAEDEE